MLPRARWALIALQRGIRRYGHPFLSTINLPQTDASGAHKVPMVLWLLQTIWFTPPSMDTRLVLWQIVDF